MQEQVQKQGRKTEDAQTAEAKDVTNEELAAQTDATVADIDDVLAEQDDMDLLADLDELMGDEEQAAELVANFVQQGGE